MFFGLDFDDGGKCAVSLMRGPDRQAFSAEECDDFGRFIPHVSRAVTIHGTLRRARGWAAAAQALIDGVPLGMMVVDDDRVVLANAAARALLKRGDSLHDAGGKAAGDDTAGQCKAWRGDTRGARRRRPADWRHVARGQGAAAARRGAKAWAIDRRVARRATGCGGALCRRFAPAAGRRRRSC